MRSGRAEGGGGGGRGEGGGGGGSIRNGVGDGVGERVEGGRRDIPASLHSSVIQCWDPSYRGAVLGLSSAALCAYHLHLLIDIFVCLFVFDDDNEEEKGTDAKKSNDKS